MCCVMCIVLIAARASACGGHDTRARGGWHGGLEHRRNTAGACASACAEAARRGRQSLPVCVRAAHEEGHSTTACANTHAESCSNTHTDTAPSLMQTRMERGAQEGAKRPAQHARRHIHKNTPAAPQARDAASVHTHTRTPACTRGGRGGTVTRAHIHSTRAHACIMHAQADLLPQKPWLSAHLLACESKPGAGQSGVQSVSNNVKSAACQAARKALCCDTRRAAVPPALSAKLCWAAAHWRVGRAAAARVKTWTRKSRATTDTA